MKKTLLVSGHPDLSRSLANKTIIAAVMKLLPDIKLRRLDSADPKNVYDVAFEQEFLAEAGIIVFQFPLYWFSVPGGMKLWIDEVFTHGFAYGSEASALTGKKLILSLTTGAPAANYTPEGSARRNLDDYLSWAARLAEMCGMDLAEPVISYGMMYVPGFSLPEDKEAVESLARQHAKKLAELILSL